VPNFTITRFTSLSSHLPLALATLGLLIGGIFLLHRGEAQAHDTIRKHHLYDIEQALYFAYRQHGTYPPYDKPTWCGVLQNSTNNPVRSQIEVALRQQHEKYTNPDKPFPNDPLGDQVPDYFYWKRSPAVFELYSILEAASTQDRTSRHCPQTTIQFYDYGINSRLRYE
jgi:hypothetical protein